MSSASQSRSARKQPNNNLITFACEAMFIFSSVHMAGKFGGGKVWWWESLTNFVNHP